MKKSATLLLAAAASVGLYSCQNNSASQQQDVLDLSARDTTVSPAENFFEYANGTWLKNTEIPADQTGWGSFNVVRDEALNNMKSILDSCLNVKDAEKGSIAQQVGDLYASALDSAAIEEAGISPLQYKLDEIDSLKDVKDLLAYITSQYTKGDGFLFSFYVSPDDKNSNLQRAQFMQGGLGLPNRNYYFDKGGSSDKIRDAYHKYVATILSLATGDEANADKDATAIFNLETQLAKASKPPVELRNAEDNYHLLSVSELSKIAPNFGWPTLLEQLRVNEDTLLVGQPEFYKAVSGLLETTPMDVWKKYLTFHLVSGYASWLSKPFADARFDFYSRTLNGQEKQEVRWKRASSLVNATLGDALGQLYVKKYFPPEAKEYMVNLVQNLQKAYAEKIKEADWLSDSTKQKALDKLNAFTLKIGYPDKWKDYSDIEIERNSLIANLERIGEWKYNYNINKLGKPVDKTEWFMTPPTVNAYFNPSFNEIVFPAGILQPPFYFQHGDDAVNYGAIGYVIGHEITHGFDDQGSKYNKDGNLQDWWTAEDRRKYNEKAQRVIDQYNNYVVLDSVHVNGNLTQGENLADNGGLAIAYAAFKMTEQGQSNEKIDGLTPDQRFFLSVAQVWRIKTKPERMLWRINNDPHSPEIYRVNGPLSNMPAFYEAFDVKPGDKMYRADSIRARIW